MMVDIEQKRLKAIRRRFIFFEKKCDACRRHFRLERMWVVERWGVNKTCHPWYYCTRCMSTAQAVLDEIDTDECYFGIYGVDEFNTSFKKDMTQLNERAARAFGKNSVE